MSELHSYTINGSWSGDRNSVGVIRMSNIESEVSVPGNLKGPGVGSNPEELLLSAAAGCYMITLSSLLSNRKIPYSQIDLESEGFVENDGGLRYDRIEHRPTIYIEKPEDEPEVLKLAIHAEHTCMVSSALRGNVEVSVSPQIHKYSASNA